MTTTATRAECAKRAARVRGYVETYRWEHDTGEDIETVLVDLLADLRHYAAIVDVDWLDVERTATAHFVEEVAGR